MTFAFRLTILTLGAVMALGVIAIVHGLLVHMLVTASL